MGTAEELLDRPYDIAPMLFWRCCLSENLQSRKDTLCSVKIHRGVALRRIERRLNRSFWIKQTLQDSYESGIVVI
jgi:hypothetical protein